MVLGFIPRPVEASQQLQFNGYRILEALESIVVPIREGHETKK